MYDANWSKKNVSILLLCVTKHETPITQNIHNIHNSIPTTLSTSKIVFELFDTKTISIIKSIHHTFHKFTLLIAYWLLFCKKMVKSSIEKCM